MTTEKKAHRHNTAFVDQPVKTFDFYIQLNEMFVSSIKHLKTGLRKASTINSNKMNVIHKILFTILIVIAFKAFGQTVIEGTSYSHFQIKSKKDTIDFVIADTNLNVTKPLLRSEERRVGKECRSRW